jgi:FAD/FMN-containing dehydrogenase
VSITSVRTKASRIEWRIAVQLLTLFSSIAVVAVVGVAALLSFQRRGRVRRATVGKLLYGEAQCTARHDAKVARLSQQLKERTSTAPLSMRKGTVSHQVPKAGDLRHRDDKVDLRTLNEIIDIDVAARTCTAESGVAFVDLVEATLRVGLVPIVVPELKTITIGGAVSGCSIESMSFVHGGFHDTCLEYEIVTAKGEVLHCTADNEHAAIFQMLHGSFGTLGILTKLRFKLIEAKRFVRVVYDTYPTLAAFKAAIFEHFRARDIDFMDAIIHSPCEYVLCAGQFVDEAPYTNRYDWMKVYYRSTHQRPEDYLTTADYFFRYDRGVTNVHPKSAVGRFIFGKFLGSSQVLGLAKKLRWLLPEESPPVIVDIFVPFSRMDAYLAWHEKEFNFYPLWCVPYRRVRDYEWIADRIFEDLDDELFVDLAIYGMRQQPGENRHKAIEQKLLEIGGLKTLISHNYYSQEEFWKTWNRPNYAAVKAITDPDNILRDIYTKTCRAGQGLAG